MFVGISSFSNNLKKSLDIFFVNLKLAPKIEIFNFFKFQTLSLLALKLETIWAPSSGAIHSGELFKVDKAFGRRGGAEATLSISR